jgi:hypothetical protein
VELGERDWRVVEWLGLRLQLVQWELEMGLVWVWVLWLLCFGIGLR